MDIVTSTIFAPGPSPSRAHLDQILELPKLGLLAVADAAADGEEGRAAVRIGLEAIRASIERNEDVLDRFQRHPTDDLRDRIIVILEDAVARAAQEVFAYARRFDDLRVTMDVVLMLTHEAFVGHVGDGRVYLVRRGLIHQLTVDHDTPEDEVFAEPDITRDEPGDEGPAPGERRLVRSLGPEPTVKVESLCMELGENDRFVLCTWALHHNLPEGVLHHHFLADPLDTLGPGLLGAAGEIPVVAVAGQVGGIEPDIFDSGRSRLAILSPMPIFAHCTERELRAIARATHPRRFIAGTVLFHQGDPGTELYLVIQGRVRIERDSKLIVTLGPGSAFGEMALLDQPLRSAAAIAEDDCEVMLISRESFFALLKGNPALAVKILWNISLRLSANLRATSAALAAARGGSQQGESIDAATRDAATRTEEDEIILTAPLITSPPARARESEPEAEAEPEEAAAEGEGEDGEGEVVLPGDPEEEVIEAEADDSEELELLGDPDDSEEAEEAHPADRPEA